VGGVPFRVATDYAPYKVQGGGAVSYADTLVEKWGTYAVTLNLQAAIDGECMGESGGEELHLTLEASGDQMVEVKAEGFQGEYPWTGTHSFDLQFPVTEGASVRGEGWVFVLHVQGQ
jgi:hypothetical protein